MNQIDPNHLVAWCESSGYHLDGWRPSLVTYSTHHDIPYPSETYAISQLLDLMTSISDAERVVWIRDWTMWNDRSQDIGLLHIALLADKILPPNAESSRIYVFESAEWRETIAFLTVVALYGWDAHLLFSSGAALVNFSHHGCLSVFSRDEAIASHIKQWF